MAGVPEQVLRLPDIPTKWDIVPIHASDIGAFLRCRRYWDWSSPTRTNLRQRVHFYGVDKRLWFGTGIHYALEKYYNPILREDPVATWLAWFELQWNGGIIAPEHLEYTYDLNPIYHPNLDQDPEGHERDKGGVYEVKGLRDLLPTDETEEFMALRDLGEGMMTFYKDYAKRVDDFIVIAAESSFSIPLGFESVDKREDSPNYGKKLEVHARGKRDIIIFRYDVGRFGILDHKTAANIGDDYFKKLDRDPQITQYLWASQKEAEIHDLPWKEVNHGIMQALRKDSPRQPTVLKNGWQPSISRTDEATTADLFSAYIQENRLDKWYEENEKAQAYYNWLVSEGDSIFIQREDTYRNKYEIQSMDDKIKMIAKEMLGDPNIYSNPTGDWLCLQCRFRAPCLAKDDGSDWQFMVTEGYEKNRDR